MHEFLFEVVVVNVEQLFSIIPFKLNFINNVTNYKSTNVSNVDR